MRKLSRAPAGSYVVAYDVRVDRERARTAKVCEAFGLRDQHSVFRCKLDKAGLRRLQAELQELDLQSGFVLIYRLDATFHTRRIGNDAQGNQDSDKDAAFMV